MGQTKRMKRRLRAKRKAEEERQRKIAVLDGILSWGLALLVVTGIIAWFVA